MASPAVRLLVAVPAQDEVKTLFLVDLVGLLQYTSAQRPDWTIGMRVVQGTYLALQRQELVQDAHAFQATHILWLDSDMRFPEDAALRLMAHNVSIVGATYSTRRPPYRPASATSPELARAVAEGLDQLLPLKYLGFGCLLTDAQVFAPRLQLVKDTPPTTPQVPFPWFAFPYDPSIGYVGEDAAFGYLAREAGYTPLCDTALSRQIRHLGTWEYQLPSPPPVEGPSAPPAPSVVPLAPDVH